MVEIYSGDSASKGSGIPSEVEKIVGLLASKESPIERVVVAFKVAAAHCATKAQKSEPLNK